MIKQFTALQLFSLTDGRLSTNMDDVYAILNHVCDTDLMTHHLPVAFNYLKKKKPNWFLQQQAYLVEIRAKPDVEFNACLIQLEKHNKTIDVPQLKNEVDTSDFVKFMIDNSLLIKKFG